MKGIEMSAVFGEYTKAREGWLFGLTIPQFAALAVGTVPVIASLSSHRFWAAAGWIMAWLLLALLVAVPIQGRSAFAWVVAAAGFSAGTLMRWTQWRSKVAKGEGEDASQPDLPGVLTGVEIHDAPPQGPGNVRIAIVQDHANATWAVTAAVEHPGLALAPSEDRDNYARGLAQLLNACARTEVITELQFMVRSVPDDGAERAQWLQRHARPEAPRLSQVVNKEQAETLSRASVRTESFCTVVVPEHLLARRGKEFGRGVDARARAMVSLLTEVEAHLRTGMGMTGVEWLTSPQLAVAVRTGFAPGDRAAIVAAMGGSERASGVNAAVPWAQAGPSGADLAARHYSHDAWNSVSFTMKLPPSGAVMGALAPVLVPTEQGERRSMTVVYQIIPQAAADRQTQAAEASADMAEGIREKLRIRTRAKDRTAIARTRRLDSKMSTGNALVLAHAVVCVTVPRTLEAAEFGRNLEASIRAAGFAPLRLDLAQDAGFAAATIPLGAGLGRQVK